MRLKRGEPLVTTPTCGLTTENSTGYSLPHNMGLRRGEVVATVGMGKCNLLMYQALMLYRAANAKETNLFLDLETLKTDGYENYTNFQRKLRAEYKAAAFPLLYGNGSYAMRTVLEDYKLESAIKENMIWSHEQLEIISRRNIHTWRIR